MTPSDFQPPSARTEPQGGEKRWRHNRYMDGKYDRGWDMSVELIAAILLWGGVGWLIDRWLGTAPWVMVAGFLIGNAAGIYLVWIRAVADEQRTAEQHREPPTEGSERGTG